MRGGSRAGRHARRTALDFISNADGLAFFWVHVLPFIRARALFPGPGVPNVLTRPVHVAPERRDAWTQHTHPEPTADRQGSHAVGVAWFTGRSEPKPQEHPGIRYAQSFPQRPQTLPELGGLEHASVISSSEPVASGRKATTLHAGRRPSHFGLTRGLESSSLSSVRTRHSGRLGVFTGRACPGRSGLAPASALTWSSVLSRGAHTQCHPARREARGPHGPDRSRVRRRHSHPLEDSLHHQPR